MDCAGKGVRLRRNTLVYYNHPYSAVLMLFKMCINFELLIIAKSYSFD